MVTKCAIIKKKSKISTCQRLEHSKGKTQHDKAFMIRTRKLALQKMIARVQTKDDYERLT